MSTPSAPYYYKEGSDTYHWETSCSKNHYPATDWKKRMFVRRRNSARANKLKQPLSTNATQIRKDYYNG